MNLGLFDAFLRKTKEFSKEEKAEKRGGLPHEARY